MLVFEERAKPEYPEENLLPQLGKNQQQTQPTYMYTHMLSAIEMWIRTINCLTTLVRKLLCGTLKNPLTIRKE